MVNLDQVVDYADGEVHSRGPDWTEGRVLSATDAPATHALCEEIACAAQSLGSVT